MNDVEIIQMLKNGDREAFRELVEEYKQMVYNVCYGFVKNSDDAEDISQDVFLSVYKNMKRFKQESKLSTWIYRIAVNRSLNFARKKKFLSLFGTKPEEERIPPAGQDAEANYGLERSESGEVIRKALNSLPENQRTAFVLSNVEGFSYKEISEIMKCSVSAVESRIHRAKMSLQKKLVKYFKN